MLSSFKPCLNACSATTSLFINASNFVQRYFSMPYLRKLSLHSVVSRILQKREGHPGDGCRPRHSRRPDARKESNCTGSCDAEILARAQMFVQAKIEHIFAIIGTSETRADLARFLVIRLRRKRANTRRQNDRPSRACTKKPHRLRNGDAALVVAGPHKPVKRLRGTCRQAGARIPNGSDYRHSAQITSPGLGASMPGPLSNM